jgi:hypothetical protein
MMKVSIRRNDKGTYIGSVPLKQLDKLSKSADRFRRWSFVVADNGIGGWLILEGE